MPISFEHSPALVPRGRDLLRAAIAPVSSQDLA
jgi:hypothetical protein